MSLNVIKLGGSNFKSATDYRRAAGIIEKYRKPLVVVVSAFFGVTDRLYAVCKNLLDSNDDAGALIEETCLMHLDLAAEILSQGEFLDAARSEVLLLECELKKLQLGVNYIDDIPEFIVDRILASGEKFNACLLKYVLLDAGIETDVLLPEDIGIYTDGVRGNAGFDFRLSENHIRNLILDEKVYIIPGFYGISQSGKITIFGRGGSDYSAACLANCLNASSLDIWKDVNGFMSADPKVVEDSERIQRLTYDEASELAYFGARILHPRTMEPLRNKHIPIRIFNIENQEPDDFPLTIINTDRSDCVDIIKSVTYSDDFAILKVRGPAVGIVHGVISRITLLFEDMR
ncbi:MAG: aspartate kinase, partial [Bacteroidota bacterium]